MNCFFICQRMLGDGSSTISRNNSDSIKPVSYCASSSKRSVLVPPVSDLGSPELFSFSPFTTWDDISHQITFICCHLFVVIYLFAVNPLLPNQTARLRPKYNTLHITHTTLISCIFLTTQRDSVCNLNIWEGVGWGEGADPPTERW